MDNVLSYLVFIVVAVAVLGVAVSEVCYNKKYRQRMKEVSSKLDQLETTVCHPGATLHCLWMVTVDPIFTDDTITDALQKRAASIYGRAAGRLLEIAKQGAKDE